MGTRRRAREAALKALYEIEYRKISFQELGRHLDEEEAGNAELTSFLQNLLSTFFTHKKDVDAAIEKKSEHWKLSRMSLVDRNILRLGITEILFLPDIPKSVTINEYLEIAKRYGTEDSSGFVNGILDKFDKTL